MSEDGGGSNISMEHIVGGWFEPLDGFCVYSEIK